MTRGLVPSRVVRWGVPAVALYVAAALLSFQAGLFPVRPLYEGLAPPQAYNWVSPPPDLAATNVPATGGEASSMVVDGKFQPLNVSTEDGQTFVALVGEAVRPRRDERRLVVKIEPLDPATIGAAPPGLFYDSNAYRITARYGSGRPARLVKNATIVMRYAIHATSLFRRDGEQWSPVKSNSTPATLQLYGDVEQLGVFVAAGPGAPSPTASPGPGGGAGDLVAAIAGLAAVAGGVILARVRMKGRRRTKRRARR